MSAGGASGLPSADFDQRGAYLTFDALEKAIIQAVAAGAFEIAAEYVDQLFILAAQLEEYHEEYCGESARLAERDAEIGREAAAVEAAIGGVESWAVRNDHPVQQWGGDGASATNPCRGWLVSGTPEFRAACLKAPTPLAF